jgi:S1-C subfamily serine protease
VTEVEEDTPAFAAGLRRGMLISHVGRTPVRTPKEFHAAVGTKNVPLQLRIVGDAEHPLRTVAAGS